ncbi:8-amino-7-oxononanoate synthase [Fusibacter sp. JL216-2]|uniref:8-amino-7-oxononanoate synthase n=1 Tax=Fusibacter sp. JL216-2 TaxID=3071453 RepID=UPI003D32FF2F
MDFKQAVKELEHSSQLRVCKAIETAQASRIKHKDQWYILFGSNNYLGLNGHPDITQAAVQATEAFGTGSGGSRMTTGTTPLHQTLERELAKFKKQDDAILFNTGYMANLGLISSITNKNWTILSDKLNHASIVDGSSLTQAKTLRYKPMDTEDLQKKLSKVETENKLIITDGIFSMDGLMAPLSDIGKIAKAHGALLAVDDAHGFGVLGLNGRGTASELCMSHDIDLHIGTFSKAIPSVGGYVTGRQDLIDWMRNKARSFIFSTALPAGNVAATLKSLELIPVADDRRTRLRNNIIRLKTGLKEMGISVHNDMTPIVPVIIGSSEDTLRISEYLLEEGYFVPAIRPPTVEAGTSRLRVSLMATHTPAEIDGLLAALKRGLEMVGD